MLDLAVGAGVKIGQNAARRSGYAYLGAIGPSLGDFIGPSDSGDGVPDPSPYWLVWDQLLAQVFGYTAGQSPPDDAVAERSLLQQLRLIEQRLDTFDAALAARDTGLLGGVQDLPGIVANLNAIVGRLYVSAGSYTAALGDLIFATVNMKPDGAGKAPDASELYPRDLLHWRLTGPFLKELLESGKAHRDQADYAAGYLTSYAGKVCGSPFLNSIVGGPYRTQWWRHRYVANYVDAWVHGYYEHAGGVPAAPFPPDGGWPSLCAAGLHLRLSDGLIPAGSFGGPDPVQVGDVLRGKKTSLDWTLPAPFCKYWFAAAGSAYKPIGPAWLGVAEERQPLVLTHALLRAWLVLWLQTGTQVSGLGCRYEKRDPVPPNAGSQPPWAAAPAPAGTAPTVPAPTPAAESEKSSSRTLSGLFAAVAGVLLFLGGQLERGGALIAGGIAAVLSNPEDVKNWDDLAVLKYWFKEYYFGYCNALHDLLVQGGFTFPYADQLDEDVADPVTGAVVAHGVDAVRSRAVRDAYPQRQPPDTATMASWWAYPTTGVEEPATVANLAGGKFASYFVDDATNALKANDPRSLAQPPAQVSPQLYKPQDPNAAQSPPMQPASALSSIVDLVARWNAGTHTDLPHWNLDADRGMYFWVWDFPDDVWDTAKIEEPTGE